MADDARVLIIEDHAVLRAMLFAVLRNQPVAVDTASSTAEAIDHIDKCDYSLILLDLNLAEHGAEEFLSRFRERRPESHAFVIGVRDSAQTECNSELVKAVLDKPLEINTLADVVRECAIVIPPPLAEEDCPPAESENRDAMDRDSEPTN